MTNCKLWSEAVLPLVLYIRATDDTDDIILDR